MWNTLSSGTGDDVVLIVDFSADSGRLTSGFSDLVPLLPDRYPVRAPHHGTWGDLTGVDPATTLAEWLASAGSFGPEVVAVVGHCVGCRLAGGFADRIASPEPPPLIFIDPLPVLPQNLLHEYVEAVNQFAPVLGPEVVARAVAWAEERAEKDPDLITLGRGLSRSFVELVADGCQALGIGPEYGDQLVHRLSGYLSYLVTAAMAPPPQHGPALVVSSHEPVPAALALDYPGTRRLDIPRDDLLRSQEVADLVTQVLATGRAGPATTGA